MQIRRRYSRERASQSLPNITSQKLERKATLNLGEGGAAPGRGEGGGRAAPQGGVREDDGRVQGEGDPEGRHRRRGAARGAGGEGRA